MNTSFKDDYHSRFKEKFDASEILKVISYFYTYCSKPVMKLNNNNRAKWLLYILGS